MRRRIHVICILYMYFPPHKGGYVSVVYLACMPSNSMPSKSHACPQSRMHALKVACMPSKSHACLQSRVRVSYSSRCLPCMLSAVARQAQDVFFPFFLFPLFYRQAQDNLSGMSRCMSCMSRCVSCMHALSCHIRTCVHPLACARERARTHTNAHAHAHKRARAHTHTHNRG
jgi:hypothetical protein